MAQTPAERRAAQRAIREQIRTNSYKPSSAGKAFRSAVERGATQGKMQKYGKSMLAVVAVGSDVEVAEIQNLAFNQRRWIGKHWNLVKEVVIAKNPFELRNAEKALAKFVRAHPSTGGANPSEFASDTDDIVRAILADPDQFTPENIYPEEK